MSSDETEQITRQGNKYYAAKTIKYQNKNQPLKMAIVIDNGTFSDEYNKNKRSDKNIKSTRLVKKHIIFNNEKIHIDEYNCPHTKDIDRYLREKGETVYFLNRIRVNNEVR